MNWIETVSSQCAFNAHWIQLAVRTRLKTKVTMEALQFSNAQCARLATQAGQFRKAIQALTSEGLAPVSDDFLDEMLAIHPQHSCPSQPSTPAPPSVVILERIVAKALQSFPSDSAPGPSLLRANHIKEAICCPTADCGVRALRAITSTVCSVVAV